MVGSTTAWSDTGRQSSIRGVHIFRFENERMVDR